MEKLLCISENIRTYQLCRYYIMSYWLIFNIQYNWTEKVNIPPHFDESGSVKRKVELPLIAKKNLKDERFWKNISKYVLASL